MNMDQEGASYRKNVRAKMSPEVLPVWDGTVVAPSGWTPKTKLLAISKPEELAFLARIINGSREVSPLSNKPDDFEGITVYLMADLNLGGREWEPIGKDLTHPFKGRFDGGGHRITGLTIMSDEVQLAGLFGYAYFNAVIRNVAVLDCRIRTTIRERFIGYAGPVCAYGFGNILNCCASGSVELVCAGKTAAAGGIGGGNLICDCYAACDVEVGGTYAALAGGISGQFTEIVSCYSTGRVRAVSSASSGLACAGGIGATINNTGILHCLALNREGIAVAVSGEKGKAGRIFGSIGRRTLAAHEKNYASPLIPLRIERGETSGYRNPVSTACLEDGAEWNGTNYVWSKAFDCTTDTRCLPLLRTTDGKEYVGGLSTQPAAYLIRTDYLRPEG